MSRRSVLAVICGFFGLAHAQATPSKRDIRPVNAGEVEWLVKANDVGLKVLSYYAGTSKVTPKNLDAAFVSWKADKSTKRAPDRVIAEGLGVVFGNLVVEKKKADWMIVVDSFGTDIAVRSPKGGELYPISSVYKRIDPKDGDINFFEPIWTLVAEKEFDNR